MSFEATKWAWDIVDLSPSAKIVLIALANHADEENCCFTSRRYIAEKTVQSAETVTRRLAELEAGGFIERTPRSHPLGGRTSDMIRLLIGAPRASEACNIKGSAPYPPRQSDKAPPCQIDEAPLGNLTRPPRQDDEAPLSAVTTQEPSFYPLKEESPLAPQGEGAEMSKSIGEEEEAAPDTQFDVFWATYAPTPLANQKAALRRWARMSGTDRAEAMTALPRYLDECRERKRRVCDPKTYLADEMWKPFLGMAPKAAAPVREPESDPIKRMVAWAISGTADKAKWAFVETDSDAWEAWREAFTAAGFSHRWTVGRVELVQDGTGKWAPSAVPGRKFPFRYPVRRDGSTDPPSRPSAAEIEQHLR